MNNCNEINKITNNRINIIKILIKVLTWFKILNKAKIFKKFAKFKNVKYKK